MKIHRKEFRLSEEDLNKIRDLKREHGIHSDTDMFIHLLREHQTCDAPVLSENDKEELIEQAADETERRLAKRLDRIKAATVITEKNTALILDAVNTMLYDCNAAFLMKASGYTRHHVIRESEEQYQKTLEHNKQIHDDQMKRGERRWRK